MDSKQAGGDLRPNVRKEVCHIVDPAKVPLQGLTKSAAYVRCVRRITGLGIAAVSCSKNPKSFDDDTHAMPFNKLLHHPSGYRCSRVVDHWTSRPFSATAINVISLARSSVHDSKAYHCILVLRWGCIAAGDVKGSAVMDFTSNLEDRASVVSGTQGRAFSTVPGMIDLFNDTLERINSTLWRWLKFVTLEERRGGTF
ncbi:hypothetical protein TSMEX_003251 [Taenia solium]|eukprot:TsM_000299300 transcript=TsM_000299300 gene=TsM_000299300